MGKLRAPRAQFVSHISSCASLALLSAIILLLSAAAAPTIQTASADTVGDAGVVRTLAGSGEIRGSEMRDTGGVADGGVADGSEVDGSDIILSSDAANPNSDSFASGTARQAATASAGLDAQDGPNGTGNATQGAVFYFSGKTSARQSGSFIIISAGSLRTSKPADAADTRVPCPFKYLKDPRDYTLIGAYLAFFAFPLDVEEAKIELWADGHARKVQFMLEVSGVHLLTEEKDISGPTKFTAEDKTFKKPASKLLDVYIYYKTASLQMPPTIELIHGTTEHQSHIATRISNPMNVTCTNVIVNKNKVSFNASINDAVGGYDVANYTMSIKGQQSPKTFKVLSADKTKWGHNLTVELDYEKGDGSLYQIAVVCTDNNGNVWEAAPAANTTFVLKEYLDYAVVYPYLGVAVFLAAAAAWWKVGRSHAAKKRSVH